MIRGGTLFVLAALFVGAGCGPNPPCAIDPSDVDAARARAKASEARLDVVSRARDDLERELREAKERVAELEAKQAQLEQAKRGELRRRSNGGDGR